MNEFTVTAPVADFTGESVGVAFKDGAGHVNDSTKEGRAAIEYFRRRGYTLTAVVDEEPEEETGQQEPPQTPQSPAVFDPSGHNADEVIAYLDSLDTDDSEAVAEFERVIAAERNGKNRKTITEKGTAA